MNEVILNENKKFNLRLFPFYKALSWDLLFYYAISFLFFTQTKGLSASQVILIDGIYTTFKFTSIIFCNLITDKLGEKRALILGNVLVAAFTLTIILANNIAIFIISQLFCAIGYNFKTITENNLLYSSIPKNDNRNTVFSNVDGRASSFYYFIDSITSLFTGFLFVINGYLPMILTLLLNILSIYISCKFKEVEDETEVKNGTTFKKELGDIKQGFKFIFKSNRLRHLILFSAIFTGIISSMSNLRSSILTDINLPAQYFGIVTAVLQILSGIFSAKSMLFHKKYRNRTLQKLAIPYCISMLVIGFTAAYIFNTQYILCLIICLSMFALQAIVKGPYFTLIKTYLNSFASHTMRNKIQSASEFSNSIVRTIISLVCSALLGIISTDYVFIIVGCVLTIFFVLLLDKMRHTVGLKPEEYRKQDIEFTEVH